MIAEAQDTFSSKLAAIQKRAIEKRTALVKPRTAWDPMNPRLVATEDDAIFCDAMRLGEQWRETANREGK